ncbi:MAG: hypothetical protein WDA65_08425 [Christensenellales bacterium]
MKPFKCPKCALNYVVIEGEEFCELCSNKDEETLLAIILNIDKDFTDYVNHDAFAKLSFNELDFDLIYERTRSKWRISDERTKKIQYVLSVIKGTVFGVWKPTKWIDEYDKRTDSHRKAFEGIKAEDAVFNNFFGRYIVDLLQKGSQNPVRYFTTKQIEQCKRLGDK